MKFLSCRDDRGERAEGQFPVYRLAFDKEHPTIHESTPVWDGNYTEGMGILRHLFIVVVIGIVFRWLWKSSLNEHASIESGRTVFPPTRAIRILAVSLGLAFTTLFVWSWYSVRKPDEWWVPYLFLGFVALSLFIYPAVLSIEVDGIGSRSWLGHEKKIRWEDVASLQYNTGNRQFVVRANDGRKITHAGFNVEPGLFQNEIQTRTRLPMKITRPGTWKSETIEVPYEEEVESEE